MSTAPEPPVEPERDGPTEQDASSPAALPVPRPPVTPSASEAGVALISDAEIDRTFRLAKGLAASGMFKDIRQAEQAFAKILIGRDLGLSPTEALMGIHLIEGKPEISANLQASFVKRSPDHDYRVLEHSDEACEIAFFLRGEQVGTSKFTIGDAEKAGLLAKRDPNPWKRYPRNMLFARAMSNGVAFHCPEVTGGVRVYAEGEIGGEEVPPAIEGTAEPDPQAEAEADAAVAEYQQRLRTEAAA